MATTTLPFILALAVGALVPIAVVRALSRVGSLRRDLARAGETVIQAPVLAFFQGGGDYVSAKTYGAAALTERRLVFRQPLGRDIEIPWADIREVSENERFKGNYRGGRPFLILTLSDRRQIAFRLPNQDRWRQEIAVRLGR